MNNLKINRKHTLKLIDIEKFVIKGDIVWVYKKSGYPKILKTDYNLYQLKLKIANLGYSIKDFKVEK